MVYSAKNEGTKEFHVSDWYSRFKIERNFWPECQICVGIGWS